GPPRLVGRRLAVVGGGADAEAEAGQDDAVPGGGAVGKDPPVQRLEALLQLGETPAFAVGPRLRMAHRRASSYDVKPAA
ncbi:MAG: hypothetical protein OXG35_06610, partial [Acidobacteria bacterium]|nr:hypothetical protein [Acidobacteriota bacterium]